ncbi:DltE [Erwinia typographi]|uniref:DltE n=1 Tax=Erwinia typographi TaxID=371042 RepID=A0A0A3ZBA5_9GAMM|nr:SDR family oxidoreductase [Erwinia typographi]KGT95054.1 DltE [Erwinia typographi]
MQLTGNTILITGGGSGIGRALAEALHAAGNSIIIAGRRKEVLDETVAANPGMYAAVLDIDSHESILRVASTLKTAHPKLNVVLHNAGIMRAENLKSGDISVAEAEITTNLLGPIRLTAALIEHLLAQPHAAILTVSSGLAFLPLSLTPTYCATKAAIHSWTQSLRYQLRETSVQVTELVPPLVQTELMGEKHAANPAALPLADFIQETMSILTSQPDSDEILVEKVKPQRFAERGDYAAFYKAFNDRINSQ